ncbi:DUF5615 family PIN-like protein [Plectonema cf. radiosum LEGE 06105]|uniref:DUF5615 family PIN-like protein n=1 Tax=Plectonema cf. radiosum LEGE 06105 TaxID=945769 RepID=A0A8J7K872_9CYAN|nr:DUF5615 family PIN-like protein [Plectonema radiosum]MBE9216747.1 DUF5615 family PIN-like protein [Plectonema cf. radiosum LEGE 06105]
MSLIRLYLDEDASRTAFVKALRKSDVDVLTVLDTGKLAGSDEEQLIWTTQQERVIYTFNTKDFCRLHGIFIAENREHSGIIVAPRQSYSIGEQLKGVLNLIAIKSAENMKNRLEFLGSYIQRN